MFLLVPKILLVYVKAVIIALGQHKLSLLLICVIHVLVLISLVKSMILVGLLSRGILKIVTLNLDCAIFKPPFKERIFAICCINSVVLTSDCTTVEISW